MHKHRFHKRFKCAILTISDKRTELTDETGKIIESILSSNNHNVAVHKIVKNDVKRIQVELRELVKNDEVQIIITTGGTGISDNDLTYEAIVPLLDKKIDGFGELFRKVSYDIIGTHAMLSRAFAGIINHKLVICLPGSPEGAKLGTELIIPEFGHILWEVTK